MKFSALGPLQRAILCKRDALRCSTLLNIQNFSVPTVTRVGNDQNPTPNPDIYPPNPDPYPTRRNPDLYPQPPMSPPPPGPSDLPTPDTDPIKRDINPDVKPTDVPGM